MNNPQKKSDGETGFTIIEVMVAMLIFLLGILGIAKLSVLVVATGEFDKQLANATAMARNDMDWVLSLSETSSSLGLGKSYDRPVRTAHGVDYESNIKISAVGNSGMRRATVNVSWQNKLLTHNVEMAVIR
jgi:prepilin-type N-terminal cleavage/methylation domain-containing protein